MDAVVVVLVVVAIPPPHRLRNNGNLLLSFPLRNNGKRKDIETRNWNIEDTGIVANM